MTNTTAKIIAISSLMGMGLIANMPMVWGVVILASAQILLKREK